MIKQISIINNQYTMKKEQQTFVMKARIFYDPRKLVTETTDMNQKRRH
jgi:hypothetical protein